MIDIQELPRKDGFPVGMYRLRYSTVTMTTFDAKMVDGVTVDPISGRTLLRLRMAYGCQCVIEPADEETLELVIKHLEDTGRNARAAELRPSASPTTDDLVQTLSNLFDQLEEIDKQMGAMPHERLTEDVQSRFEELERDLVSLPAEIDLSHAEVLAGAVVKMAALHADVLELAKAPPQEESKQEDGAAGAGDAGGADAAVDEAKPVDADPELQSLPVVDSDIDLIEDRDVLAAIATGLGIELDGRWGVARLRTEIRMARDPG